ncbi:MAG: ATP-binding protein [Verrucomicrobiae bacterium]|nr:ATP-binding protein [Verrucomicrobiae bacterium]
MPPNPPVARAILRVTADNGFRLFIDGREIGRGSDWRYLTEFDLTRLLGPGPHTIAVEAFNERAEAGVLLGLRIDLVDGTTLGIGSDSSWLVVPNEERRWEKRTRPGQTWQPAKVVGAFGQAPWKTMPYAITQLTPPEPLQLRFWQRGWFQLLLLSVLLTALVLYLRLLARMAVQSRAQTMLQLERVRIARDIHDDVGAALTQLVLQGEILKTELPDGAPVRAQLDELCERARAVLRALDEVVWAVNSRRDTLRDFSSYVCKYAQEFFGKTQIRCRLDVEPEMPAIAFDLVTRRGLFMAVKEALSNVAKHSGATEVFLRIGRRDGDVLVVVEDNGRGFDPARVAHDRNGLVNMAQRLEELGGHCSVWSEPGRGCRVEFRVPLAGPAERRKRMFTLWRRARNALSGSTANLHGSSSSETQPLKQTQANEH